MPRSGEERVKYTSMSSVLGCKLCISCNWVASMLLLKSATFLFGSSFKQSTENLGRKCFAEYWKGRGHCCGEGAWWLLHSSECYSSLETQLCIPNSSPVAVKAYSRHLNINFFFDMSSLTVFQPWNVFFGSYSWHPDDRFREGQGFSFPFTGLFILKRG